MTPSDTRVHLLDSRLIRDKERGPFGLDISQERDSKTIWAHDFDARDAVLQLRTSSVSLPPGCVHVNSSIVLFVTAEPSVLA